MLAGCPPKDWGRKWDRDEETANKETATVGIWGTLETLITPEVFSTNGQSSWGIYHQLPPLIGWVAPGVLRNSGQIPSVTRDCPSGRERQSCHHPTKLYQVSSGVGWGALSKAPTGFAPPYYKGAMQIWERRQTSGHSKNVSIAAMIPSATQNIFLAHLSCAKVLFVHTVLFYVL